MVYGSASCTRFSFSSSAWKESEGERSQPTTRQLLAERLLGCGELEGAGRDRVRRLLGEPSQRQTGERRERAQDWYYDIGPQRGLSNDEELRVDFGSTGSVRSVTVLHDDD